MYVARDWRTQTTLTTMFRTRARTISRSEHVPRIRAPVPMSFSHTAVVDATLTMSDGGASSLSSSFSSDGGGEHLTIRDMDTFRRRVRERTSRITLVTSKMMSSRTSRASYEDDDDDDDLRV